MSRESVLLGMSGGIDSTAACEMLQAQGYKVVGLTLLTCDASQKAAAEAATLATRFGIESLYDFRPCIDRAYHVFTCIDWLYYASIRIENPYQKFDKNACFRRFLFLSANA